jgi:hypothetical protein
VNTVADLLVTIQPIFLIATLELPLRRRIGAIILVSLGFVVCFAGGVRAYYTWRALIHSYDETWECYGMWFSGAIEIDLGIVSCLFLHTPNWCLQSAALCLCSSTAHHPCQSCQSIRSHFHYATNCVIPTTLESLRKHFHIRPPIAYFPRIPCFTAPQLNAPRKRLYNNDGKQRDEETNR